MSIIVSTVTSLLSDDFDIANTINGSFEQVSDRYNEIIRHAGIAQRFSEAELNAFRDCCNGTLFAPAYQINGGVWINFADTLIDGLAEKYEIDASVTIAKLRELTYPDQVALVEDIEKFWRGVRTESRIDELYFADSSNGSFEITSDRYAEIIRRAGIPQRFSDAELNAFRDCCNGTLFDPAYQIDGGVLINFEDTLIDGIAEKYGIDASATIVKLRELTFPDQVALVEDIEKFWIASWNAEHGL